MALECCILSSFVLPSLLMTINSLFPNSCGLQLNVNKNIDSFESLKRNGGQVKLKLPKGSPNKRFTPTILEQEFSLIQHNIQKNVPLRKG